MEKFIKNIIDIKKSSKNINKIKEEKNSKEMILHIKNKIYLFNQFKKNKKGRETYIDIKNKSNNNIILNNLNPKVNTEPSENKSNKNIIPIVKTKYRNKIPINTKLINRNSKNKKLNIDLNRKTSENHKDKKNIMNSSYDEINIIEKNSHQKSSSLERKKNNYKIKLLYKFQKNNLNNKSKTKDITEKLKDNNKYKNKRTHICKKNSSMKVIYNKIFKTENVYKNKDFIQEENSTINTIFTTRNK